MPNFLHIVVGKIVKFQLDFNQSINFFNKLTEFYHLVYRLFYSVSWSNLTDWLQALGGRGFVVWRIWEKRCGRRNVLSCTIHALLMHITLLRHFLCLGLVVAVLYGFPDLEVQIKHPCYELFPASYPLSIAVSGQCSATWSTVSVSRPHLSHTYRLEINLLIIGVSSVTMCRGVPGFNLFIL